MQYILWINKFGGLTMAKKEERILHIVQKLDGRFVGENRISAQEAIERMAKAICASNMAPDCLWECATCDRWKGSDKEAAEAALNALLEDNNASKN